MEIIRAGAEWKERIIAFADRVFGEDVAPEGFAGLIPDLYGPRASCDGNHLLVLEEGEIQALLLAEPTTFVCGGRMLKGLGVGTVSVSEQARGKGYMQKLLSCVREGMERDGYAFAVLSGQRQRYSYWGYEPTGTALVFELTGSNVKHALCGPEISELAGEISLVPLEEGSEWAQAARKLYESQCLYTVRKEETFVLHLCSGHSRPMAVLHKGRFAGYLTASFRRGQVCLTELLTDENTAVPDQERFMKALLLCFFRQQAPRGFSIRLALWQKEQAARLEKICESCSIQTDHQYYIADMEKMLDFSLFAAHKLGRLPDGDWQFATEKGIYCCHSADGKTAAVLRKHSQAPVFSGKEENRKIFTASEAEMTRILFSPLSGLHSLEGVPAGWLPLPLCLAPVDAV